MPGRRIIFDTSAINALAADRDSLIIARGLDVAYQVGITETAISEVIATPDEPDRNALLDVFKRLIYEGKCIMPFQWIIEEQAKAYQRNPAGYDWKVLDIRFRAAETEIARQEILHTLSEETRVSQREWDKQFREIFKNARPAFQKLFDAEGTEKPSLQAVTEKLLGDGGAHLTIGAGLVERATGTRPTEAETKDFMERCPPFKALLVALCFAQYDRCIRGDREESLGRAGRADMFSAVYLPYCRVFVTDDEGQYKALRSVADLIALQVEIAMYDGFKAQLFGLEAAADSSASGN